MNDRVLIFRFDKETPERLDKFLVGQLQEFSRSRIQGLIADGSVDVNGRTAKKAGQTLESGFSVTVRIPPVASTDLVAEDIPLDIVFENEDLIVVNKPAGMVVHPAAGHSSGTLVNAVLGYEPDIEGIGGEERPGVVHRLDKETSGLILLAKNERVLKDPAAAYGVSELADSYISIAVKPWVSVPQYGGASGEIYKAVVEAFRQHNIEMPFPQRQIRILNSDDRNSTLAVMPSRTAATGI